MGAKAEIYQLMDELAGGGVGDPNDFLRVKRSDRGQRPGLCKREGEIRAELDAHGAVPGAGYAPMQLKGVKRSVNNPLITRLKKLNIPGIVYGAIAIFLFFCVTEEKFLSTYNVILIAAKFLHSSDRIHRYDAGLFDFASGPTELGL